MLAALRQRDFALLWLAGLVSLTGDRVLSIALPFFVYDQTGSALATGAMFAAQRLPPLLVSAVAGVLVDRLDRRRALVAADLLRGLLLLALLFVRSVDHLWIVYLVAFAESAVSQFAGPAKGALLPRLVPEGRLPAANALVAQAGALTTFVGPTLGGALMALLGLSSVVLVDVASYLGSALLISLISARVGVPATGEPKSAARRGPAAALTGVWRDWLAGLRLVRADRVVSSLFGLFGLILLAQGMLDVLWLAFVRDLLGGGPLVLGWLAAIAGGGILVGGFVVGRLGERVPPGRLIAASGVCLNRVVG